MHQHHHFTNKMYADIQTYTCGDICFGYRHNSQISPKAKILFHFPEFDKKSQNCVCSPDHGIYMSIYVPAHNKQML